MKIAHYTFIKLLFDVDINSLLFLSITYMLYFGENILIIESVANDSNRQALIHNYSA